MDSRERVYRALQFTGPDRVPRDLWTVPGIAMFRAAELHSVVDRFPNDIILPNEPCGASVGGFGSLRGKGGDEVRRFEYGESDRSQGSPYRVGTYVDEWGVPFQCGEDGVVGEVKNPPVSDWAMLRDFAPPWEVLANANWDEVNRICRGTGKFVLTPWHVNPFERMQYLRGSEQLYLDLGYGAPEILTLRDMVHEFNLREIELWCKTEVDGIRFADDWGTQNSLLISPTLWRELFKPLYVDYCQLIRAAGKFVFFHSDGNTREIIPDLLKMGVDAVNLQLFVMDIEELGREYRGHVTFWGEIDRQRILPFGNPCEVRRAVRRVRHSLDAGTGGVIAQLEWGKIDPQENVEAAFQAWLEPEASPV
jgi:hypothetical protein